MKWSQHHVCGLDIPKTGEDVCSRPVGNLQAKTYLSPVEPQEASKCLRMWREDQGTRIAPSGECRDALGSSGAPLHLGACIE